MSAYRFNIHEEPLQAFTLCDKLGIIANDNTIGSSGYI